MDFGPWINVIDKKFNIHVIESKLSKNLILENEFNGKNEYGVEFYDHSDNLILYSGPIIGYENQFNKIIKNLLTV